MYNEDDGIWVCDWCSNQVDEEELMVTDDGDELCPFCFQDWMDACEEEIDNWDMGNDGWDPT